MADASTFASNPDAAYAQYLRDGVFVEPDVLTPAECDELIEAANHLPPARDGSFLPIMQVHRDEPAFMKTLNHPRIVKIMDRLCGGPVVAVQTQLFYTPFERAGFGYHQDNYFVEAPDQSFASAWVPLVDVTPDNGALFAFRGSHKHGLLPVREVENTDVDKRQGVHEETILPEPMEKMDISAKRGSAVLIHGFSVHGSYQNMTRANRYVILNTYIREGAPFRPGHTAQRAPVPLTR